MHDTAPSPDRGTHTNITIDPSVSAFLRSPHGLLINDESGPARPGADMPLYNPTTGAKLARMARAGAEDVDRVIVVARRAFGGNWAGQRPADHECLLLRLAERIEAYGEQLAQLKTLNNSKSINLSRALEVGASVEFTCYMAGWATKIEGRSLDLSTAAVPGVRYRAYTVSESAGVVGAIVSWNFPLLMVIWRIVPVLACGYTVILKPTDGVPLTALRLGQLCLGAGIPPGMANIVTGTGTEAGVALVAHPDIDKLAFTDSTPVSKLIEHVAMENMTRFSLELGDKSPVIILDDTSLGMAAAGSAGAIFFNQEQVYTAGPRLYVQCKRFDQVLEHLAAVAGDLSIDPGLNLTTQINPPVSARQQEQVLGTIESGIAEGVSMICSGTHQDEMEFYMQPTIFAGVIPGMQVVCEEIFRPVLIATPFNDLDEAVRLADDSIYEFGTSIWSNDLRQVMNLVPRTKAGTVQVNAYNLLNSLMPLNDFKQSGIGCEMGHVTIEAYTENKSVCIAY